MFELLIAFVLSVTAPGSGQIFNGDILLGCVILFFFIFGRTVILPLMARFLFIKKKIAFLRLIYFFNILYVVVLIIAVLNAALSATHAEHTLTGAVMSFIIALLAISVYRGLKSRFIITALSGHPEAADFILSKKE
jgi:hypothetical protein